MGNANAKLWEAVEASDTATLCEVLKHKEVDIDQRKEFKLGRRNWNQQRQAATDSDGLENAPSAAASAAGQQTGGGGGASSTLTEVKNEMRSIFQGVDKDSLTPLHVACMRGNREIVQLLLAHGADIHIKAVHERYGPASLRAFLKRGRKTPKSERQSASPVWHEDGTSAVDDMYIASRDRLDVNGRAEGGHRRSSSSSGTQNNSHHQHNDPSGIRGGGGGGRAGRNDLQLEGLEYIKYCQYTALYYACKFNNREVAFDILLKQIEVPLEEAALSASSSDTSFISLRTRLE